MTGSDKLARVGSGAASAARGVVPVVVLTVIMWASEIFDQLASIDLDRYGIIPRDDDGVRGIAAAPFLHGGFDHLIANTGAFLVLGCLIAWTTKRYIAATVGIALIGGLGTWIFARTAIHIGASGLVYGYAAFLLAWGVLNRRVIDILVAIGVVVVYGGIVTGLLPGQPGISWEGHLFGAIAGVIMAWVLRPKKA